MEQARAEGVELIGAGGLLTGLTKTVLETALEAEMTEHLGYDKHDPAGRNGGNSRNGTRSKTVLTEIGPVEIEVPRDRDGSFEPGIVRKRQRRLDGIDEIVLSLSARGLTTGEIAAHFAEVYGARCRKDTISRITDAVLEEMTEWQTRPLDRVYPVVFIDAIVVKVRDGQVINRPVYVAIGVTVNGERDILGLWAGDGGEGAKFWLAVLTEIKNRGVEDVLHPRLRRAQGPARRGDHDVAADDRADVRDAPAAQHVPLRLPRATGTSSPGICDRSTPRPPSRPPQTGSPSSPTSGAASTGDHPTVASTRGPSSCRSSTTTSRSARSSARPTRSSRSTPATGARSAPAGTSRPNRPR